MRMTPALTLVTDAPETADYHAVNSIGVTVKTFSGHDAQARAVKWAKDAEVRRRLGLLEVHEVTTIVRRRRVYRPMPRRMAEQPENVMAILGRGR